LIELRIGAEILLVLSVYIAEKAGQVGVLNLFFRWFPKGSLHVFLQECGSPVLR
jgi:hypothetical protein